MYFLTKELYFPSVEEANYEGILAVGGDLSPERLLLAYSNGIFPWFNEDEPILWWAPEERMVLFFENLKISKSMRSTLKKGEFKVTFNKDFKAVITNCQTIQRNGQKGTWISDEMVAAYYKLHELGYAKSVEVWKDNVLVGGLYGIDLGDIFCGESMFSKESNASKVAFITLAQKLEKANYKLIDCQVHNHHLESLGCIEIHRDEFMYLLQY